jgi:hypothetical protein
MFPPQIAGTLGGAHCLLAPGWPLSGVRHGDRTLSQGIEVAIPEAVREIVDVVDVTDHASGNDPYFGAAKE